MSKSAEASGFDVDEDVSARDGALSRVEAPDCEAAKANETLEKLLELDDADAVHPVMKMMLSSYLRSIRR